jgi:hypothetical protein
MSDDILISISENQIINLVVDSLDCEKLAKLGSESLGMHDRIDAF